MTESKIKQLDNHTDVLLAIPEKKKLALDENVEYCSSGYGSRVGLFELKRKGYLCWAGKSLLFPPFSIFVTAFCIGKRLNEKHLILKYILPGSLLMVAFGLSIWSIVRMVKDDIEVNQGQQDQQGQQGQLQPSDQILMKKMIEFVPIIVKVIFAFCCFQLLFLQRQNFIRKTKREEAGCVTCLTSKFCFPCSFAQMALETELEELDGIKRETV